jgi:hypothetical protein
LRFNRQTGRISLFLINDFGYQAAEGSYPLSDEFTEWLLAKRRDRPDVAIILISDPLNTVYGSRTSPHFEAMRRAGVRVVLTDLDKRPDSNPVYSIPWRLSAGRLGVGPGCALPNPMGEMLGNRYVYSRKPSPNFHSGANPDWQAAEADMRKTRAVTRDCNVELLLRDLYTVNGERGRLAKWVEMTKTVFECQHTFPCRLRTLDRYVTLPPVGRLGVFTENLVEGGLAFLGEERHRNLLDA